MRKPPPILALMSRRATLLHGGISIRAWTSARLRSCHSNELRSLKFGHSVERFDGDSDFSRAAGTVARFEGLVNHPSCSFLYRHVAASTFERFLWPDALYQLVLKLERSTRSRP